MIARCASANLSKILLVAKAVSSIESKTEVNIQQTSRRSGVCVSRLQHIYDVHNQQTTEMCEYITGKDSVVYA